MKYLLCLFTSISILSGNILAQTGDIKGSVKTSDGFPAAFVSVIIKGTNHGAVADENGNYFITDITPGTYELVTSLVGLGSTGTTVVVVSDQVTEVKSLVLKETASELNEVVILAEGTRRGRSEYVSKIPLKAIENSQVYSTIDKEILTVQQVNNMEDAMKNATGVSVVFPATGRATDGGTYYTLRGFTTNASLINGVAGSVYNNPDAINIERIEVIKGPSATLFGSSLSSFGGAINVVTKKPYEKTGINLSLTTGSWGLYRMAADFNTPLNKEKTALFRLNTAYHSQNSFQDYGFTKRFTIAPSFTFLVNDRLSFNVETNFSNIRATLPCWYYADSATTGVTYADELNIDDNKYYLGEDLYPTTNSINGMAQMNYILSSQWTSQTVYSTSYNHSLGPLPYLWFISDTSMTRNVQVFEGGNVQSNIQQNFIGQFKTGTIRHRLLIGGDYYQNLLNSWYKYYNMMDTVYTNQPNPNYLAFNSEMLSNSDYSYYFFDWTGQQNLQRIGGYFSDVINFGDKFIVNLGLRYDFFMSSGFFDPTSDVTTGEYQQGGFSPKVGLIYQPIKDKIALFANFQNSFQNVNGTDFYGNVFKPQNANQYEGGVKYSLVKDRVTGSVSYYDITVSNTVRTDPEHFNFSKQDGTQRSKGIEAEINLYALNGFSGTFGYGYNDNQFVKADEEVQGRRPVDAGAAHLAHAWVSYQVATGKMEGWGLGFGGKYSGDKYVNNDSYSGVFFIPSYTVLNSSLFYQGSNIRVALNMNNITSERYWVGWNNLALQKPREVVASISWNL